MRKINKIIVHCADTRTNQDFSILDIRDWHLQRGWSDVGYHYYIKLNGQIQYGRSIDKVGAHCKGQNSRSIGICLEGGKDDNGNKWLEPTSKQIDSIKGLIKSIKVVLNESIDVFGHYHFSSKSCPNFNIDILK